MKYKIIATDLDGTLANDKSEISAENINAIKKAMDAGIKVVICSGRSYASISNFAEYTGLNKKGCYGIAFNGSVVYEADTMKILYEERLNYKTGLETIEKIKSISPEIPLLAYAEGNLIICEHEYEEIVGYADRSKIKYSAVDSFENYFKKDIIKLLIHYYDYNEMLRIYNNMENWVKGKCAMFFSGKTMLEFASESSNKGAGLKILSKHLGVKMEEIVAIGDNFNDMEMIKEAGLGVAVNNAISPLKEAAGYVTKNTNNQNAVKEVIDMILGGF